jgi:hypothetical protein
MTVLFQYGSNCLDSRINSEDRLRGDAKFLDIAETVEDFELAFDAQSKHGYATADIVRKLGGKVWGVLYDVPDYLIDTKTANAGGRSKSFDAIEGKNYRRETITVRRSNGEVVLALTYTVISPEAELKTSIDYVRYIVRGLREHRIPDAYISKVKDIASANNPDIAAQIKEL